MGERAIMVEEKPNVFVLEQQHSGRKDERGERKRAEREERRLVMETKQKEASGRHNLDDVCRNCDRSRSTEGVVKGGGRLGYLGQDQCAGCEVRIQKDGMRAARQQSFGFQAQQVAQRRQEVGTTPDSGSPENQLRRQLRGR